MGMSRSWCQLAFEVQSSLATNLCGTHAGSAVFKGQELWSYPLKMLRLTLLEDRNE